MSHSRLCANAQPGLGRPLNLRPVAYQPWERKALALRTRIAVTFLLLLAAVLAAALGAVLATNRDSAGREVKRQLDVGALVFSRLLESNRRQLTQAAQAHHPIAEYRLGLLYEQGVLVQKDLNFARTLYTQAAAAGVLDAKERLVALGGSVPETPPGKP